MPQNEKGGFSDLDLDHRRRVTKVRGGWTEAKVIKELKRSKGTTLETSFLKDIAMFDTPEEFAENLFYHGSGRSIGLLKPSIILGNTEDFGGGGGEKYFGVSLSTDRNIASNFTGASNSGNVAPVILKRGSIIKELPEISDANELDEIITDLWTEGVDAVKIGDHSKGFSEREIVVLNPSCLSVGKPTYFRVFKKEKMPSFDKETLHEMWETSSEKYEKESKLRWDEHNVYFKEKFGKEKDPAGRWTQSKENLVNYHKHNVELYKQKSLENKLEDSAVMDFLNKNAKVLEEKPEQTKRTRKNKI